MSGTQIPSKMLLHTSPLIKALNINNKYEPLFQNSVLMYQTTTKNILIRNIKLKYRWSLIKCMKFKNNDISKQFLESMIYFSKIQLFFFVSNYVKIMY